MKRYFILLSYLFSVGLLQAQNKVSDHTKKDNTDAKGKVMQTERNIINAMLAGDTMKLKASIDNDFQGYFSGHKTNKEMMLKNASQPEAGVSLKDINMDAKVYGNAAVVNGVWELTMENHKPVYLQFMDMLIWQNGSWQMVASQNNEMPVWRIRKPVDSELEVVTAESCETESTLKSLNSNVSTFLRFLKTILRIM